MKRLYLIRHAKSSWKNPELNDIDRPLNKRGKQDAPFMAQRLKKYKAKPDHIVSSPAKRALKTATIVAKEIGFSTEKIFANELIYVGGKQDLIDIIREFDDSCKTVIIVGHNPEFNILAEYLSGVSVDNIPTCGVFCMDFNIKHWKEVQKGTGIFVFLDYPKKHNKKK